MSLVGFKLLVFSSSVFEALLYTLPRPSAYVDWLSAIVHSLCCLRYDTYFNFIWILHFSVDRYLLYYQLFFHHLSDKCMGTHTTSQWRYISALGQYLTIEIS